MNRKSYYAMTKKDNSATINIYGDITSFPWLEGDVSSANLSRKLEELKDVSEITVYINSYGGEVAEGLAIYNSLKRHKAKVTTYCDGFAASIASVIFMAGDERIMNDSSLLMIHNAWSVVQGNAEELRKQADDLDKITKASVVAYKAHSTLSEDEIQSLMDAESWILPEEAMEYGFATAIEKTEQDNVSQNARMSLREIVKMHRAKMLEEDGEEPEEPETDSEEQPEEEPDGEDDQEAEDDEIEAPDNEDESSEEEDEEKPTEEAAQRWSGFFNALMK